MKGNSMKVIKKLLVLTIFVVTLFVTNVTVYAASFSMSASKSSVSPNSTFTISVGGDCIGRVNLSVSNGTLSTSSVWVEMGYETVTVTAGGSGTVTVTATPTAGFSDADGNEYNPGSKSVSVKINTPGGSSGGSSGGSGSSGTTTPSNPTVNYSKDNNLKSLTISEGTLSPAFSASTTSYTVELASTVTSLKVDAVANDTKASVKGTGTKELEPGENTIKITVTAENGNPKVYTITAIVDETPLVFLPYNGKELGVVRNIKNVKEPNGFEQTKVKVNGNDTVAWHSSNRNVTLLYLQNENDKDFYVFDGNNVVSIYKPLNGIGKNLAYVGVPSELQERSGMTFGEVTIKDTTLQGWTYKDETLSNYSIIYAMNESGEYNYYQYESSENTLQLYPNASLISQEEFDKIVKENELIKDEKDSMTMYFYIACGVAVVTSIFGIVGFVNASKYKNRLLTRNRFSESND